MLGGLGTLPRRILTVTAYERAGGTSGLEAGFIEHRLTRATQHAGIGEERVRTALLALVDPVTGQKNAERPNWLRASTRQTPKGRNPCWASSPWTR